MEPVILLGAQGSAPASPVTIDGVPYGIVRVDAAGFVQTTPAIQTSAASAAGSVTAPAAGAAIVTSPALATGLYEVQVLTDYGGTVATAETFQNMRLQVGATVVGPVFTPPPALATAVRQVFRVSVVATTLSINAVNAGSAAAVYQAVIIWTRIV